MKVGIIIVIFCLSIVIAGNLSLVYISSMIIDQGEDVHWSLPTGERDELIHIKDVLRGIRNASRGMAFATGFVLLYVIRFLVVDFKNFSKSKFHDASKGR